MTSKLRMPCANGEGYEIKKYEEILFPNLDELDPERGMRFVEEFQYIKGDIVNCTFPKSGTHWLGNMTWKLKALDAKDRPADTFIEYGVHEPYANQEYPRIIFSHQKPSRLYPKHIEKNGGRVVLMLRNPKDITVSFYYHMKNASVIKSKQTWNEWFQSFIDGEVIMGSYFTYLKEWEQVLKQVADGESNLKIAVVYYEEFARHPKENIARLNTFLEFHRDDAYLEKVLEDTSFAALRGFYNTKSMIHATCCDDSGNSVIFRKGHVGDWKTHLTVAQSELVDKLVKDSLKHGLIHFNDQI